MPRFAILEHRWNGVHWDFLLEAGDSLRTWAIDAPIRPGVDLPARALPDHRSIYLDYEGPVGGNRGEVLRWDWGTYTVRAWEPDRVLIDVEGVRSSGPVALLRPDGAGAGGGADSAGGGWIARFGNVV